jgi:hypothetical protein
MLIRERFGVRPTGNQELDVPLPLTVQLAEDIRATLDQSDEIPFILTLDRRVDPLALKIEAHSHVFAPLPNGTKQELTAIHAPGNGNIHAIDFTTGLTFLTDIPLGVNRLMLQSELVAEDEVDRATLDALGTRLVFEEMATHIGTRTFGERTNPQTLEALMPKTVGLRIYADAVALNADVPKYRELWRVLESAFGLQGKELVTALALYPPAQELGFDENELKSLLTLRGQVSHAATRGGLAELLRVGGLATGRVARLKCLAERVILTKRTWGTRDREIDELAPAVSWVTADGTIRFQFQSG